MAIGKGFSVSLFYFFTVDEYTTIAKEKHGYNTEQVKMENLGSFKTRKLLRMNIFLGYYWHILSFGLYTNTYMCIHLWETN